MSFWSSVFLPVLPVTNDYFLAAVFGGIITGTGVGIIIRNGGSLDGTEIVAILTDKKTVFEVSRSNYIPLMKAGVKIFEYMPGFIHSKTFIADDKAAVVGTTNIDNRSFYLHFELSVLFVGSSVVKSVKDDFERTFELSELMTPERVEVHNPIRRFIRYFLRLFSPAF